jgi:hypothetical protein
MKLETTNKVLLGVVAVGLLTILGVYLYNKGKFQFILRKNEQIDEEEVKDI